MYITNQHCIIGAYMNRIALNHLVSAELAKCLEDLYIVDQTMEYSFTCEKAINRKREAVESSHLCKVLRDELTPTTWILDQNTVDFGIKQVEELLEKVRDEMSELEPKRLFNHHFNTQVLIELLHSKFIKVNTDVQITMEGNFL